MRYLLNITSFLSVLHVVCWMTETKNVSKGTCTIYSSNVLFLDNHHNRFTVYVFWDNPGELVPEENFWTLWCKGRLTEADTPTIRLGATPSGLTSAHLHHPPIFHRPDALPATQPTVSKH